MHRSIVAGTGFGYLDRRFYAHVYVPTAKSTPASALRAQCGAPIPSRKKLATTA
jgi:hypothetical protein